MALTPAQKSLLDFIAIRESNGNYDAYIGHANAKGTFSFAPVPVSQVYQMMRHWVQQGEPSSAAGKYQIIQRTLSGLVQRLGIPLQTPFTPDLQDQLAAALLSSRGYESWLAKKISDEAFMHNLSCEWASLPDPYNGGKSHYDGVGPNHAGQTLATFQKALTAARNAK